MKRLILSTVAACVALTSAPLAAAQCTTAQIAGKWKIVFVGEQYEEDQSFDESDASAICDVTITSAARLKVISCAATNPDEPFRPLAVGKEYPLGRIAGQCNFKFTPSGSRFDLTFTGRNYDSVVGRGGSAPYFAGQQAWTFVVFNGGWVSVP